MSVPALERILQATDSARHRLGFFTVDETAALARQGVQVLDPFSTLVSPGIDIDADVVLYPNVTLSVRSGGSLRIRAGSRLSPGTAIDVDGGSVTIGAAVEIGDGGGFTIRAAAGVAIVIGDRVRLTGGGSLSGACALGDGAQILGRIDTRDCCLAGGGAYDEPDPDRRGAVLKGVGQARGLSVGRGQVIQAFGLFSEAAMRSQSFFHPKL